MWASGQSGLVGSGLQPLASTPPQYVACLHCAGSGHAGRLPTRRAWQKCSPAAPGSASLGRVFIGEPPGFLLFSGGARAEVF